MPVDFSEPRPVVTPEIMETLDRRFGLTPDEPVRDLGGAFSLNVLITASGTRYVARVHGTQTEPPRLAAIQTARRHLLAGGVPTPEQAPTRDGEAFVDVDGLLLEVERYVEHDSYMNTWDRLEMGLPYLGRTHSLFQSFDVARAGRHAPLANHIEPDQALTGTLRGVQRMRSWHPTPEELDLAATYEELAHLVHHVERTVSSLPRQLVHGDFWDNNVLFNRGAVVLVTDLDFMAERLRIDDVALTLFFANSSIGGDRLSEERIRKLRALVDAYDSGLTVCLSTAERRAIPAAIARQPLWNIGWWVPSVPDEQTARRLARERGDDAQWTLALMRAIPTWQDAFTA